MENKVYRKGYVDIQLETKPHKEYITLYNLKPLIKNQVVIPIEKISGLIKELITIKIELEKYVD